MAVMTIDAGGLDLFNRMLQFSSRDLKKVADAGARVARTKIIEEEKARFNRNYDADHIRGTTARNTELKRATKKSDGYAAYVTFNGTRNDGWKVPNKKPRRNAEVAFINQYGAKHKKYGGSHPARPFMTDAVKRNEEQIIKAMHDALPDYAK